MTKPSRAGELGTLVTTVSRSKQSATADAGSENPPQCDAPESGLASALSRAEVLSEETSILLHRSTVQDEVLIFTAT